MAGLRTEPSLADRGRTVYTLLRLPLLIVPTAGQLRPYAKGPVRLPAGLALNGDSQASMAPVELARTAARGPEQGPAP